MKFPCACPDVKDCPNELSVSESEFFDDMLAFRVKGKGALLGKEEIKELYDYLRTVLENL